MLKALTILIFGSLFISALISPSIYSLVKYFFPQTPWPYSRLFDRVLMVVVFFFLIFLKKDFSVSGAIKKFKEVSRKSAVSNFTIAFIISLGVSIVLTFFLDMQGKLVWVQKDFYYYFSKIIKAFLSAIVISILEESFFRVILFDAFKKKLSWIVASVFCSLCYASVHFIAPAKEFVFSNLSLSVGFEYYSEVLKTMFFPNIFHAFFGLFLVGLSLCVIMQKMSCIYINMGLHTGWVLAMKLFIYSTGEASNVIMNPMHRRYFLVTQGLGWLSIVIVFLLTMFVFRKTRNNEQEGCK